jgi:hypothetical protein
VFSAQTFIHEIAPYHNIWTVYFSDCWSTRKKTLVQRCRTETEYWYVSLSFSSSWGQTTNRLLQSKLSKWSSAFSLTTICPMRCLFLTLYNTFPIKERSFRAQGTGSCCCCPSFFKTFCALKATIWKYLWYHLVDRETTNPTVCDSAPKNHATFYMQRVKRWPA